MGVITRGGTYRGWRGGVLVSKTITVKHNDLTALSRAVARVANLAPDFDGHDPFGSAMMVWFECAEQLAQRGDEVPTEWDFRQGLGLEEDLDESFIDFSSDYLRLMGDQAMQLVDVCRRLKMDY